VPLSPTHIDAFRNLTSLRCLTLWRVFSDETDKVVDSFMEVIGGLGLEELNIQNPIKLLSSTLNPLENVKNLKKVEWTTDGLNEESMNPLWKLLSNSTSTLTTLCLPFEVSLEEIQHRLFTMRFPNLRSLILGNWAYDVPLPVEFHDFILAHSDTLELLDLDYCNYDEYRLCFEGLSLSHLGPDSLPHLREFRGHSENLLVMAKAQMNCLKTSLRKLTVGPGGVDTPTWELKWMFDALQENGGFGILKELDLDMSQWEERERNAISDSILQCAQVCGASLEVWNGTLPNCVQWKAEELGGLFGKFEMLKVIRLPRGAIESGPGTDEYIRILAAKCKVLELVTVYFPSVLDGVDQRWVIKRRGVEIDIRCII